MDKESMLKDIIVQFIELAPDFKRFFLSASSYSKTNVPRLTSLQYLALLALDVGESEPMPMNGLSALLNISKQQTTKLVDGLVNDELIERYTNPENRREVLVKLTAFGVDCLAMIGQSKYECLLQYFEDYSDEEMSEILGHIRALNVVFKQKMEIKET